VHWTALRALYASVASAAIIPLQDALGLGNEARMNNPGTGSGNWEWRLPQRALSRELERTLRAFSSTYGRFLETPPPLTS
jgi:4-alpha-glucanotransferase